MDAANALCEGCHRTLDEIAAWGQWDDDARLAAWQRIEQRLDAIMVAKFPEPPVPSATTAPTTPGPADPP